MLVQAKPDKGTILGNLNLLCTVVEAPGGRQACG